MGGGGELPVIYDPCCTLEPQPLGGKREGPVVLRTLWIGLVKTALHPAVSRGRVAECTVETGQERGCWDRRPPGAAISTTGLCWGVGGEEAGWKGGRQKRALHSFTPSPCQSLRIWPFLLVKSSFPWPEPEHSPPVTPLLTRVLFKAPPSRRRKPKPEGIK